VRNIESSHDRERERENAEVCIVVLQDLGVCVCGGMFTLER